MSYRGHATEYDVDPVSGYTVGRTIRLFTGEVRFFRKCVHCEGEQCMLCFGAGRWRLE